MKQLYSNKDVTKKRKEKNKQKKEKTQVTVTACERCSFSQPGSQEDLEEVTLKLRQESGEGGEEVSLVRGYSMGKDQDVRESTGGAPVYPDLSQQVMFKPQSQCNS